MIEWHPYDKQKAREVFDCGRPEGVGQYRVAWRVTDDRVPVCEGLVR